MRTVILLVIAAGVAYVGFAWTAGLQLENRFGAMRDAARGACMTRGTDTATVEGIEEKLQAAAEEHGVDLSDVEVEIRPLDPSHDTVGGAQVQAGFGGSLAMTGTVADMRAHMFAKRWLWDAETELKSTCTIERTLQRVLPQGQAR